MWWKTIANEIAWKGRLTYRGVWKCDICGSQDMEIVNTHKADKAGSPTHEYRALMMYRCNKLRDRGVNAFVMLYHRKDKQKNRLARWANRRWSYWSGPFNANDNTGSGHICDYRDKT